jgi:hypothetical protein
MFSRKLTRSIAIGTVAIAAAIGAYAIVNPGSSNGASGTANAATFAQPGQNQSEVQNLVGDRPVGGHWFEPSTAHLESPRMRGFFFFSGSPPRTGLLALGAV